MEAIIKDGLFYFTVAVTLGGASVVAFSRSIIYAAVGLIFSLMGVAGLYVYLGADFIAVAQVMIYVGGVVILILFAILLTQGLGTLELSNPQFNAPVAFVVVVFLAGILLFTLLGTQLLQNPSAYTATTKKIGDLLLSRYVLPFEIISVLIVVVIMGAAVMVRKELLVSSTEESEDKSND